MANQNSLFNFSEDSARSPAATSGDRIAVNHQIPTVPFCEASDSSLEEDQTNEDGEVKNEKDAADEDIEENLVNLKENDEDEDGEDKNEEDADEDLEEDLIDLNEDDEDGDAEDFEEDEDYDHLVKMNRMKKNHNSLYRKHGLALKIKRT